MNSLFYYMLISDMHACIWGIFELQKAIHGQLHILNSFIYSKVCYCMAHIQINIMLNFA